MPDKCYLVIGATGQVAQSLKERSADGQVILCGRPDTDITRPESLVAAIDAVRPALVINASAYTAVDKAETDEAAAFAVNADGPTELAGVTAAKGLPLIHVSTDYVFDGEKPEPYVETDPVAPLGVYGRSKLAGEEGVAKANLDHVILRTAWVYSPFGGNFIKTMLRLAADRDSLNVVHDQRGNPTSALDIADGILAVAHRWTKGAAPAGVFHMTATGEASWAEFAEFIFASSREVGGPAAVVHPIPASEYPTPARRPANSRLDCTKLHDAFGVQLPGWQQSARACIQRLISKEATAL